MRLLRVQLLLLRLVLLRRRERMCMCMCADMSEKVSRLHLEAPAQLFEVKVFVLSSCRCCCFWWCSVLLEALSVLLLLLFDKPSSCPKER